MGLDMYLQRKIYVGSNYEHRKVKASVEVSANKRKINVNAKKIVWIIEEAGYWRKSNQIHAWFVKNVQDGKDDCGSYDVSFGQLQELKALCKKVIKEKKPKLLPPAEGFFFGSTDTDDYYYEDLKETIKIIDSLKKDDDAHYEYRSSW